LSGASWGDDVVPPKRTCAEWSDACSETHRFSGTASRDFIKLHKGNACLAICSGKNEEIICRWEG